jgi:phosphomannomutase/phosphoglucomutase
MINTPEIRIDCPDDKKVAVVQYVTQALRNDPQVKSVVDVDGVRANFGDGWGLVRASNTQPALVMRCEGATDARLAEIRATVERHLDAAKAAV